MAASTVSCVAEPSSEARIPTSPVYHLYTTVGVQAKCGHLKCRRGHLTDACLLQRQVGYTPGFIGFMWGMLAFVSVAHAVLSYRFYCATGRIKPFSFGRSKGGKPASSSTAMVEIQTEKGGDEVAISVDPGRDAGMVASSSSRPVQPKASGSKVVPEVGHNLKADHDGSVGSKLSECLAALKAGGKLLESEGGVTFRDVSEAILRSIELRQLLSVDPDSTKVMRLVNVVGQVMDDNASARGALLQRRVTEVMIKYTPGRVNVEGKMDFSNLEVRNCAWPPAL